jgi:DNA polymerase elongation subunit (family B)
MLQRIQFDKVLFLDIETVPQIYQYQDLEEKGQELFYAKNRFQVSPEKNIEMIYNEKGGILAEETLLKQFKQLLEDHYNTPYHVICGHNSKEFDIPYICRRMLINGIPLPGILDIAGKKPWEVNHLDTLELWKFGDYKAFTSLALLCHVFHIPTPKDDISGADVARVYYEENDLKRITVYCEKDVVALIQLLLRMRGDALVSDDNISSSNV